MRPSKSPARDLTPEKDALSGSQKSPTFENSSPPNIADLISGVPAKYAGLRNPPSPILPKEAQTNF
jgi:hypothetical protein